MKRCYKCGQIKDESEFNRNSAKKDGLSTECRTCHKAIHHANKEHNNARLKQWRSRNQEHIKGYQARYYQRQRAEILKRQKAQRTRTKNRRSATYRAWRIANQDKRLTYQRKYRAQNKAYFAAKQRARQSLLYGDKGRHTEKDVQRQYETQQGKCFYCHVEVGETYHVDHYIPLSRGGSNEASNIVVACPNCNQSKGNKLPNEWKA